jgi:hypothetical protein
MAMLFALIILALAGVATWICWEKGKRLMGTSSLFVLLPLCYVGAIRIAKPNSNWAKTKYGNQPWKMRASRMRPKEAYVMDQLTEVRQPELAS